MSGVEALIEVLERWFQLLCFATAFYITLRAGLINIAFASIAGLAAIGFVLLGNSAAPYGPIAVLLSGFCGAALLAFALTAFVRWLSRRSRFPDLLVSLFLLYVFGWIERALLHVKAVGEVQYQRTHEIALPVGLSVFLSTWHCQLFMLTFCILVIVLFFAISKHTVFNYRTEILAQNRSAILLIPNQVALNRDAWIAIAIAALAVGLWVTYDVGLRRGQYEPDRYFYASWLGLAAAVCIERAARWVIGVLLALGLAIGEWVFYQGVTGHTQIPSDGIYLLFGLIILSVAGWQYQKYGRHLVRAGG